MKKNMGNLDRILRVGLAILVIGLYFGHIISGTVAIIGLAFAGILIVTSFVGSCPLYLPFGIDTREKNKKQ